MRVIAGTARGRRFETLPGLATRPTLDRVKESVFGSLQFDLPGSSVLDLFSGSGSLAFEALSRGAAFAVCNDVSPACTALIRRNAAALHLDERLTVLQLDYRAAIERIAGMGVRFDFAFLDAPYESGFGADAAERLFRQRLMQPDGRILIEHAAGGEIAAVPGVMRPVRTRRFGKCAVTEMERDDCMEKIGVYPGSFDPLTVGHMDVLRSASALFERIYIGVLCNSAKKPLFSTGERVSMIEAAVAEAGLTNVSVDSFDGLLVEYTKRVGARYIIRGLRAITDFEYEFQLDATNRHLEPSVHTVYFMASPSLSFLSSSTVREIGTYGGNIAGLVPDCNLKIIAERLLRA